MDHDNVFRSLIAHISSRVSFCSTETLGDSIDEAVAMLAALSGADRAAFVCMGNNGGSPYAFHASYGALQSGFTCAATLAESLPWVVAALGRCGEPIVIADTEQLPDEAASDKATLAGMGIVAALFIPLPAAHQPSYVLALASETRRMSWPVGLVTHARIAGELLMGVLQRRETEAVARRANERLDLAARTAECSMWEYDVETGVVRADESARKHFGFGPEEDVTLTAVMARIHHEDRPGLREAVREALQTGGERTAEFRVLDPSGKLRWLVCRSRLHESGPHRRSLMGVSRDVTRYREMELQLKGSAQDLAALRMRCEPGIGCTVSASGTDIGVESILGTSEKMREVVTQIRQVARTGSTVLLQGETGTGKGLFAQAIHNLSERKARPMITVNCAALPVALVESELFGREKGAYTGALSRQCGRFETADGSTLFLDEISEVPLETQAKLLRVLQDGEFERLGSPRTIRVDVRVIAATNRDLQREVEQGRFRRDLYYRLNIFPIEAPPLRERAEDIPQLVWEFVAEFGDRMGRKIRRITARDMDLLQSYSWPGNVRELRNVIEHSMIVSKGETLELQRLSARLPCHDEKPRSMAEMERHYIKTVLKATCGRIKGPSGAAEQLKLKPSTLYSRMRKLGISAERP